MKDDFYLILPSMRSCHNVGAMFRTADAFGVKKIFLVGYTAAPPKPQIDKVSLGAELWMPWEKNAYLGTVITKLKKMGVSIVALEKTERSVDISKAKFTGPTALIVGNEVKGVRNDILKKCDQIVHVPMYGRKQSLNVSVAAGIAMHEIREQISNSR